MNMIAMVNMVVYPQLLVGFFLNNQYKDSKMVFKACYGCIIYLYAHFNLEDLKYVMIA